MRSLVWRTGVLALTTCVAQVIVDASASAAATIDASSPDPGPGHREQQPRGVSVKVSYNSNFDAHAATLAGLGKHKVRRASAAVDAVDAAAAAKSRDRAPTLFTDALTQYVSPIDIGTPPQRLNVEFDTGSTSLWVYSTRLPSSQVNGQRLYDPAASSTARGPLGGKWKIAYGELVTGDSASGVTYRDRVAVGSVSFAAQTIGVADRVSDGLTEVSSLHGILGLSSNNASAAFAPAQETAWFANVEGSLEQRLFTANLKHRADGNFNFGYIDAAEPCGPLTYAKLVYAGIVQWGWVGTGYAIGDAPLRKRSMFTLADTGSSGILLENSVASDYYAPVEGAEYEADDEVYTFPCDAALPSYTFEMEGAARITVPAEFLNAGPRGDSGRCLGMIQNGTYNDIFGVLGQAAMKAAIVVFDRGNMRIGWAPKRLDGGLRDSCPR